MRDCFTGFAKVQYSHIEQRSDHLRRSTLDLLPSWWRMEVRHPFLKPGEYLSGADILVGRLSEAYDVRRTHEQAREEHDPYLAPHGFFRRLKHRYNRHALEFLEEFGPLKLTPAEREGTQQVHVQLDEFWGLHLRFCLVCDLWESLDDREKLAEAWKRVHLSHAEASAHEDLPLGSFLFQGRSGELAEAYSRFPWERAGKAFEEWRRSATHSELRESALWLIHGELDLHMRHRHICWERGWEPSEVQFRPLVFVDSLWSLLWEFFGLDTAEMSWRRCPHCQQIFYARRKDQFYCTPRQQALASKRAYAARRRSQAKPKLKKQKREQKKGTI